MKPKMILIYWLIGIVSHISTTSSSNLDDSTEDADQDAKDGFMKIHPIKNVINQLRQDIFDNISNLQSKMENTDSYIRRLESILIQVNTKTGGTEEKMKRLYSKIVALDSRTSSIQEQLGKIDPKIVEIDTKTSGIKENIERINPKLLEMDNKRSGIQEKLERIDHKIVEIDTKTSSIKINIESMNPKLLEMDNKTSGIQENMERIDQKIVEMDIDNIQNILERMNPKIVEIDTKTSGIQEKLEIIDPKIVEIDTKTSGIQAKMEIIDPKIEMYAKANGIREKLEIMYSKIVETDNKTNSIEQIMETMRLKMVEINTKASSAEENLTQCEPVLKNLGRDLKIDIDNLKTFISSTIDVKLGKFETDIGNIKEAEEMIKTGLENIAVNVDVVKKNILVWEPKITSIRLETDGIKTTLNELTSLPNSLENQLQNMYKASVRMPTNSSNAYPLLLQLFSKAHLTVLMSLNEIMTCYELNRVLINRKSGVYEINNPYKDKVVSTRKSVNAYCDMDTAGGGWTVFQRRGIPGDLTETERSDLFNKRWDGYKNGFGDPDNDYWLGLDSVHQMTKNNNHELLITATHINGTEYQAHYSFFRVASEKEKFKLTVGGYNKKTSTMDDWLSWHNGASFSTIYSDNDSKIKGSCSVGYMANGFWFKHCFAVSLNGVYSSSVPTKIFPLSSLVGIFWGSPEMKLQKIEMKIRLSETIEEGTETADTDLGKVKADDVENRDSGLVEDYSMKTYFTVLTSLEIVACYELNRVQNNEKNGVYKLYLYFDKEKSVNVYCDMENAGGRWTVFQRRGIPGQLTETERSDLFNKTWYEYKNGFGDPNNDYWLGLDTIHELTKECNHELLITATHLNGTRYQVHYSTFGVASEADQFKLTVDNYVGGNSTLEDGMSYHNGGSFSTIDRDNDEWIRGSCSVDRKANGFWFKNCFHVNLNGIYPYSRHRETMSVSSAVGIVWDVPGEWLKFKRTEMKIRASC